ncbi:MAG: cysteine-rich CWC family protein [Acidobacteriota bacterium]
MEEATKDQPEQKVCGSCGKPFGCGAKLEGCWCTELTLTKSQAEDLKTRFNDCLCPSCLAELASRANAKLVRK